MSLRNLPRNHPRKKALDKTLDNEGWWLFLHRLTYALENHPEINWTMVAHEIDVQMGIKPREWEDKEK